MRDDTTMLNSIAEHIERAITNGEPMVRMPWHGHTSRPRNFETGNPYRGGNCVRLWFTAQDQHFTSGVWATFKQFAKLPNEGDDYKGVDKVQKATARICKMITTTKVNKKTGQEDENTSYQWYPVFNIAQTDLPMDDLPLQRHSTALQKRFYKEICGLIEPSGTQAYDALVAEIALAFVLADQGYSSEPMPEHAQYLRAWLSIIREEDRCDPSSDHFRLTVAMGAAAKIAAKSGEPVETAKAA